MIEIYQTKLDTEEGDCVQACIASLLSAMRIGDVPDFRALNNHAPMSAAIRWLHEAGYAVLKMNTYPGYVTDGMVGIAAVPSRLHLGGFHAVLFKTANGRVLCEHDPLPRTESARRNRSSLIDDAILLYFIMLGSNARMIG